MSYQQVPGKGKPNSATDQQVNASLIGGGIVAVLLLVFILQNRDRGTIDFLFWSMETSIWFGLLLASGLTLLAERLVLWALARRKRHRAAAAAVADAND